jgi:hypothetical protein
MKRIARWIGLGLLGVGAVYLLGRGIVEILTVDPSRPSTYRDDWGGPTYFGVLAVHAGPAVLVVAACVVGWRRRRRPGSARGGLPTP